MAFSICIGFIGQLTMVHVFSAGAEMGLFLSASLCVDQLTLFDLVLGKGEGRLVVLVLHLRDAHLGVVVQLLY